MSAYKYYDRIEELEEEQKKLGAKPGDCLIVADNGWKWKPVVDTEKYHAAKQQALDDLFREPQEGDLRARPDGKLEMFFQGKWELHA